MTLPACRHCGYEIVTDSPRCPYCGRKDQAELDPKAEFKSQATVGLLTFIIAVLAVLLFWVMAG